MSGMEKDEMLRHLQAMVERHNSTAILARGHLKDLWASDAFSEEEKEAIGVILSQVVQDIVEHKAILSDLLSYAMEGKSDTF